MMEYFIISLVSFLGVPFGWFLDEIAEGEVRQYSQAMVIIKELLVLSLFAIVIWFGERVIESLILFLIYQALGFLKRSDLQFTSLAAPLWLSYPDVFPLSAILCFTIGMFYGSFSEKDKTRMGLLSLIGSNSGFLLIAILLGII